MSKTPDAETRALIAGMQKKTGKTLEEWKEIAYSSQLTKHNAIAQYLEEEHGLAHEYAALVAHRLRGTDSEHESPERRVETQYSEDRAPLRPIYEAVVAAARGLGEDVEVSPKSTYVALCRNKQFAIVQPTKSTRVDLGLNLGDKASGGRLEGSSDNSMVSHRVRLKRVEEVDAEVVGWLREAYERA